MSQIKIMGMDDSISGLQSPPDEIYLAVFPADLHIVPLRAVLSRKGKNHQPVLPVHDRRFWQYQYIRHRIADIYIHPHSIPERYIPLSRHRLALEIGRAHV